MSILTRIGLRKTEATPGKSAGGKVIKVGPGETLRKIALREYGDEAQWDRIYQANKWKIDDPEMIYPGMELRLP
jgi:nucleoid-associated protein YgaU